MLYGCESWTLILRDNTDWGVFENRMLRRIFGHKMDEVAGGWRRLQKKELHKLHASPNIIRVIK
jgi:hypothetical protein